MGTLTELRALAGEAASLWWTHLPRLLAWFCVGFSVHQLGLIGSALVTAEHLVVATLLFVLGVLGWLTSFIMMIHTLKPALWAPRHPESVPAQVPAAVFAVERRVDVLTLALAPFLAVYSVWGVVEDEVADLLFANISGGTLGDASLWSVSFSPDRLGFYAGFTAVAYLVSKVLALVRARLQRGGVATAIRIVEVVADGAAVFSVFVALGIALDQAKVWWEDRQAAAWLDRGWRFVLESLPDVPLWADLTLPEAVRDLASWFWSTLLPATSERVALPLMWLALTATVFGWREFRGRDIAAGTRWESAAGRLDAIGQERMLRSGPIAGAARLATDDLRNKYLPVANALRLIWYAGPRFVGVYLVLATALWAAQQWADRGLTVLVGPQSESVVFAVTPFQELLLGAVFVTASIALYAAAFDRAVAEVAGATRRAPAQRESRTTAPS